MYIHTYVRTYVYQNYYVSTINCQKIQLYIHTYVRNRPYGRKIAEITVFIPRLKHSVNTNIAYFCQYVLSDGYRMQHTRAVSTYTHVAIEQVVG